MPKTKAATAESEEPQATGDTGDKPVKQQVREAAEAGKSRREIADEFGLSYQRVYQLTKDLDVFASADGTRARVIVEASDALTEAGHQDLVGKPRVEAIRTLYTEMTEAGTEKPIGKIAKLLGTSYQVVFQATKSLRAGESGDEGDEEPDLEDAADGDDAEGDEDEDEGLADEDE